MAVSYNYRADELVKERSPLRCPYALRPKASLFRPICLHNMTNDVALNVRDITKRERFSTLLFTQKHDHRTTQGKSVAGMITFTAKCERFNI